MSAARWRFFRSTTRSFEMNPLYVTRARLVCFANDNTAFIPELR